jgi:ankyrin repeat protein
LKLKFTYSTKAEITALMLASQHGHVDIVSFLLEGGVDKDAQNEARFDP